MSESSESLKQEYIDLFIAALVPLRVVCMSQLRSALARMLIWTVDAKPYLVPSLTWILHDYRESQCHRYLLPLFVVDQPSLR